MTEDEKKYRDHLDEMVEKRTAELKEEIAELKNAEKNLKSERDKLQSFMDALDYTGIGVDIVGVDYKIVFQNETLKRKFGDLTGELCYEKYMGLKEPCEFCPMKKAIETGKPQTVRLTAIDGRDYQLFSAPIQNRDGSVDKVAEVVIDITELKRAEDLMRTQRDLALSVTGAVGLEEGVQLCLDAAIRVSGMDSGGVYLVDEASGSIDLAVHKGLSVDFINSSSHYDADSSNARIVMAGKPIYTEYLKLGVPLGKAKRREALCAIAVIPVCHAGRVIACLNLASHTMNEVPSFSRDALETICAQMSSLVARLRAEDALRKGEEKYRILTETVPDIIFTLDRKGRFTYINPAGENIVGYSIQDFLGHDFTEILAPEYIDTTKDRFKRGLSGERISLYEVEIMHKDGQKVPVELNMTSLFDEDRNIIGRLGVARDIRESRRVEKMLRESEDRYRTIFENTGTAMVILEEDKAISLANAEFERLSGYSREEIEGKKRWTEFVMAEDLERMKGYHEQRRVDPTIVPKRYEFRLIDRKGSIRDILLSVDVIPGTKISLASLLDITERKKAEEKIKASLKEKEVLLREIHHRVKNNMQIVSSLLRLQSAKVEDKKTQEILKGCQNRIRTMALIHEKLYQSKDLAKINFAQYIDGLAVHVFQSYGVDSNLVAVKTDLEEVLLDLNRAIPCGLIINELLSNSIKHAFPEGKKGEICINLHSDKKGMITLVVSDNGIGLPDDIDFRKAQSLGLQMVNDLTRQIGGTIKLDRKAGTAFTIKFPVNK